MLRTLLLTVAASAMVAFASPVRAASDKMDSGDLKFIRNATEGGQMEVELGKVAAEKATNADVKQFGQHMVDDHSKANQELAALCQTKGVDLTDDKPKMDKKVQKAVDKLSKKEGADFDKQYVDDMVKDHETDVKEFQKAAEELKDQDLKTWAAKTLPTLQSHLDMITSIQGKLGK
jgi:putative membrane protein